MDSLMHLHDFFYAKMGTALYYTLIFIGIIAIVGQWRLYEKGGQPGYAALVPFWNVVVFLKLVGRPAKHAWLFLIPFYGQFYFAPKVWIEMCQSFGKRSTLDYVLVIIFNGLYILNMGLSYETKYQGPVYGKQAPPPPRPLTSRPLMA
jgi:signal peptidase I